MTNHKATYFFAVAVMLGLAASCKMADPDKGQESTTQYLDATENQELLLTGKHIADSVGAVLKSNLMQAMGFGGPVHAVEFCNVEAFPLTGELNTLYNVQVKRTSDRIRNAGNAPSMLESSVISDYRNEQAAGITLRPKLALDADGRKVFFAPIFTGAPCLICHGNEANMDEGLRDKLTELYPADNAKGFGIDELRGIWSVTFNNS